MLTKLLKYEFRSIGRQLIPLYLGVLVLAGVNHFFWFTGSHTPDTRMSSTVPAIAAALAYSAVCVALVVITVLLLIQRFYKGLLTDEGYLMFTLPCKPWQLIAAKGLAASVMVAIGAVVGILSAMLMALDAGDWWNFLGGVFHFPFLKLFREYALWPVYIIEAVILAAACLWNNIGHVYVSISLGHLSKKYRIALALVAYIVINVAWSVLLFTTVNIFDGSGLDAWLTNLSLSTPSMMHFAMLGLILSQIIPTVIYFFATNWILSNKLNLE